MPDAICSAELLEQCAPRSAYYVEAFSTRHRCAEIEGVRVCGDDIAVLVMTSNRTAERVAATLQTWVPAAQQLGMGVVIAVASEEGAEHVRKYSPGVELEVVHVPEYVNHRGSKHVQRALRRMRDLLPERRWYVKVDDDTFMFPSNLVHRLAYQGSNASDAVVHGNILNVAETVVSGGAGYVMSRVALDLLLQDDSECMRALPDSWNEDMVVSACLERFGARFVHLQGLHMGQPQCSFSQWRMHHRAGEMRYPITFHWATPLVKLCLACTCAEHAGREAPLPSEEPFCRPCGESCLAR